MYLASLKDDAEKLTKWWIFSSKSKFMLMKSEEKKIEIKDAVQDKKIKNKKK